MRFLKEMFNEKGNVSMMRVLSLISLLIGGYLAITGKDASVTVFVGAAFIGKAGQKFIETNNQSPTADK